MARNWKQWLVFAVIGLSSLVIVADADAWPRIFGRRRARSNNTTYTTYRYTGGMSGTASAGAGGINAATDPNLRVRGQTPGTDARPAVPATPPAPPTIP